MYLRVVGVVFSRWGGWYPVSHAVQGGAYYQFKHCASEQR